MMPICKSHIYETILNSKLLIYPSRAMQEKTKDRNTEFVSKTINE